MAWIFLLARNILLCYSTQTLATATTMENKMGSVMSLNGAKDEKTKEERIRDFIKSMSAVEQAIEPFKEQKADIKKSYVANGWLDKNEIKTALKAYRLLKDDTDMAALDSMYRKISGKKEG